MFKFTLQILSIKINVSVDVTIDFFSLYQAIV